jgi:hypothetical protein
LFCAIISYGSIFCGTFKTVKIENETDNKILVAMGHDDRLLTVRMYTIGPRDTLKITGWNVDNDTNIFVHEPVYYKKSPGENGQGPTYTGFMYFMPLGTTIDVKYSSSHGLRSNSLFLSNKKIYVTCTDKRGQSENEREWVVRPVSECHFPVVTSLTMQYGYWLQDGKNFKQQFN